VRSSRRVPLKRLIQISTSNHIDRRAVLTAGGHVEGDFRQFLIFFLGCRHSLSRPPDKGAPSPHARLHPTSDCNLRSHVRLLNGCHSVWQKLIDNPMMPSPFGHTYVPTANYQIKLGAKHGRWLYWGNKKQFPHSGVFAWLESGGTRPDCRCHGWNVANQKFFRAPVRFDFLATGRENGGPTEVIDKGRLISQESLSFLDRMSPSTWQLWFPYDHCESNWCYL
jgi:hypothetical protein